MSEHRRHELFAYPRSGLDQWLDGMRWFWRAGERVGGAVRGPVGFGRIEDLHAARNSIAASEISGAVLFVAAEHPGGDSTPACRVRTGVAGLKGGSVRGSFALFDSTADEVVLRSNLGIHAVRLADGPLLVGADPAQQWGQLDRYWIYPLLARFVAESLRRPLFGLPPVGALRLDDIPGNAQQQLEQRDHSDSQQQRRIRSWISSYARSDSVLNLSIPAQALGPARERVPLDTVWPRSIAEIAAGVRAGVIEPVCHGLLHLDTKELDAGRIEFREFARLGKDEAAERIAAGIAWQETHLGRPPTFVAPAWSYGAHGLDAAKDAGVRAWLKPAPGPMAVAENVRETLIDGPPGHNRLDYRPLSAMAAAGIPPTVILHGTMLDGRMSRLDMPRDLPTLAGLLLKRDIVRLPGVDVRWIGAGELFARVLAHDALGDSPAEIQAAASRREVVEIAAPSDA